MRSSRRASASARALWKMRENIPEAQRREGVGLKHDISRAGQPPGRSSSARAGAWIGSAVPDGQLIAYGHAGRWQPALQS